MRAKPEKRSAARALRAEGRSLRQIARELEVALSSVSVWVRDVPLPTADRATGRPAPTATRLCSRCRLELPVADFGPHGAGRQWWCRACFRDYFAAKGDEHRRRSGELKRQRIAAARQIVNDALSIGCRDCDERDPVVLEFDHVAAKRAAISSLVSNGAKPSVLKAEIERCEVVCANCHRQRTATRGRWARLDLGVSRAWRTPAQERNMLHAYCLLLASGCVDCRCLDLVVLDFDHIAGKTASVMRLAQSEVSLARLEAEARRCVVRCANCHRRRTAKEAGHYRAA